MQATFRPSIFSIILVLISLFAFGCGERSGPSDADLAKASVTGFASAAEQLDMTKALSYMAPTLTETMLDDQGNVISRYTFNSKDWAQEFIDATSGFRNPSVSIALSNFSVSVSGDNAVVNCHTVITIAGTDPSTGNAASIKTTEDLKWELVKSGGKWLITGVTASHFSTVTTP